MDLLTTCRDPLPRHLTSNHWRFDRFSIKYWSLYHWNLYCFPCPITRMGRRYGMGLILRYIPRYIPETRSICKLSCYGSISNRAWELFASDTTPAIPSNLYQHVKSMSMEVALVHQFWNNMDLAQPTQWMVRFKRTDILLQAYLTVELTSQNT